MILSVPQFDQNWLNLTSYYSTSSLSSFSIPTLPSPLTFALNYRLTVRSNLSSPVIIWGLGCEGEKTTDNHMISFARHFTPSSPPSFPDAININVLLRSLIFHLFSPLCTFFCLCVPTFILGFTPSSSYEGTTMSNPRIPYPLLCHSSFSSSFVKHVVSSFQQEWIWQAEASVGGVRWTVFVCVPVCVHVFYLKWSVIVCSLTQWWIINSSVCLCGSAEGPRVES